MSHFLEMRHDDYRNRVEDNVIEDLWTRALERGIRVFILYWSGDQFLDFPPSLIMRARQVGVRAFPMSLSFLPRMKAFQEHCEVSRSDRVRKRMQPILLFLWG